MTRRSELTRVLEPEVMDTELDARDYDAMDHAVVNARFAADLAAVGADLGRTLDVGTGTALIPIELCRREPSARVLGIDLAESMLALARRNVERAGLAGVIALAKADAKGLAFADGAFSCVVCNTIVHHVPEPRGALAEMRRVLAPGGTLFVRDLARPADAAAVDALVSLHAAGANDRQRALFEASLRAGLTLDEVAELVGTLDFARVDLQMTSDRHWTLIAS